MYKLGQISWGLSSVSRREMQEYINKGSRRVA